MVTKRSELESGRRCVNELFKLLLEIATATGLLIELVVNKLLNKLLKAKAPFVTRCDSGAECFAGLNVRINRGLAVTFGNATHLGNSQLAHTPLDSTQPDTLNLTVSTS